MYETPQHRREPRQGTTQETRHPPTPGDGRECITILARDSASATAEFHRLGLGARGFSIAGRVERHRFAIAGATGDAAALFNGEQLYAATYVRNG